MKGPAGKGIAEMAVAKQKGANCETPSSEPGFSLTDRDFDFDDEMEVRVGLTFPEYIFCPLNQKVIPDPVYPIVSVFSHCVTSDGQENDYIQRRMSDPSSNLKNYVRGWNQRREVKKAISEQEVNNCYANGLGNGINEVEAGDVLDGKASDPCFYE